MNPQGTYYPPGVIELVRGQLQAMEELARREGYPPFETAFQVIRDYLGTGQPMGGAA